MSGWAIDLPKHPILSDEEMRVLLSQAQSGSAEAKERIVECNLRLVASIVSRYSDRDADMDDLFQIGCIGLVKAIDGFDLSYEVKFSTYAVPKIIGEIKRYLREATPLRVSRSLRELASKGLAVKEQLTNQLGRTPLVSEIAAELQISNEELIAAFDAVSPLMSLQQVVHEDDGDAILLEDQLAVEPEDTPLVVKDILSSLNADERRLLLLRYFAEKSQIEVAADLGISQAQVSRIEKRILEHLRKQLQMKG